ncbi:DUF1579 domain-containing protein [Planctomycetales bacterium ZRK34]|nr:DUF1579 domain-containing protein [Planctomycetales bacterium ZRK34]
MTTHRISKLATVAALAGIITAGVVWAAADQAASPFQLPPGWTAQDMAACMLAGTPGEPHKMMVQGEGTWTGQSTMWMFPGADPIKSGGLATVKPIMDGRYVQIEWTGEIPGMGAYHGMGINGYDNVKGQYVSTYIDNHSTGIVHGTGQLSPDQNTMTWTYHTTCPLTKKPTTLRQVETMHGEDAMTLEMYGADPKTGKEFKMLHIEYKREKQ